MTVAPHDIPFVLLATAGERLGWIFTDRGLYRREFVEPPPELAAAPQDLHDLLDRAVSRRKKRRCTATREVPAGRIVPRTPCC